MTRSRELDLLSRASRTRMAGVLESRLIELGVARRGSLLVAASGGADSTALLVLTAAVARRRGWNVEAATVDHHLREGSRADAEHALGLAALVDVPCTLLDVHPERGPGTAARARQERYRALAAHASERGLAAVVTGHHARDQLETMVMALVRGAGARAAGGMPARRRLAPQVVLLRPLLEVSPSALEACCRRLDLAWRYDPTNDDERAPRIRIRKSVAPLLEALRPGAAKRAAAAAATVRAAGRLLERRARRDAQRAAIDQSSDSTVQAGPHAPRWCRSMLARWPRARRQGALRAILTGAGAAPSRLQLHSIDAAVMDGKEHGRNWHCAGDVEVRLAARWLEITPGCTSQGRAIRHRRSVHR